MRFLRRVPDVLTAGLFFFGLALLVAYVWTTNRFETATIEIIFLYLSLPLTGVDIRYVLSLSSQLVAVACVTVLFAYLLRKSRRNEKVAGLPSRVFRTLSLAAALGLSCGMVWTVEKRYQLYDFLFPDGNYYTYIEDNLDGATAADIAFEGKKRNVVLVILESGENALTDPAVFNPILMPRVDELGRKHTRFAGHRQCVGSEFSIASFQSLMLGVPLLMILSEKAAMMFDGEDVTDLAVSEKRDFRDVSLPGILEKHGYTIKMFRCADARFTAYGDFMDMLTDNCEIYDYEFFRNRGDVREKQNYWGVNDGFIYEKAKEHMLEVYKDETFFLFIQTVGTHAPGSFEPGMERPYGDFRDSYVQADILVDDFVKWIGAQEFGADTAVVIVGDHLQGVRTVGPVTMPPPENGGVLTVILNSATDAPTAGDRPFATWDLPPTILEAAGATWTSGGLGMGVSLYSARKNTLEKYGFVQLNRMLKKRSRIYDSRYRW